MWCKIILWMLFIVLNSSKLNNRKEVLLLKDWRACLPLLKVKSTILSSVLRRRERLASSANSYNKNIKRRKNYSIKSLSARSNVFLTKTRKIFRERKPSGSSTKERKRNASVKRLKVRLTQNSTLSNSNSNLRKIKRSLAFSRILKVSLETMSGNLNKSWTRKRRLYSRVMKELDALLNNPSKNASISSLKSLERNKTRC